MKFNYRGVAYCIAIAIMCVGALWVVSPHARAEGNDIQIIDNSRISVNGETFALSTMDQKDNGEKVIPYVHQGDIVFINDTIDISGVVPPYPSLAYWDGYGMYDSAPTYNISVMSFTKEGYYKFYLDPSIFNTRIGRWYKYGNTFERQGNNLAFVVAPQIHKNSTMRYQNGTLVNISASVTISNYTTTIPTKTTLLPEKHISDYVISRGSSLNISVSKTSAIWIFDSSDNSIVYSSSVFVDNSSRKEIILNESVIQSLPPNSYKILIQSIGNTTPYFDVIYNGDNTIKWFDRTTFAVHTVDLNGMTPDTAISTLEYIFKSTYDEYTIKRLEIQEPEVTITRMDKVGLHNAKEYFKDTDLRGSVSLMDVRGYTNGPAGTNISVILDIGQTTPRTVRYNTFHSVAQGTSLGDLRQYQVYVPLYEDSLAIGMHTLTASTDIGGSASYDFPISVMPADSFQENATVKWVGDENPWKPNMTIPDPVIKVVTVVQTQVVIEKVTPSPEEIKAAQDAVISQKIWDYGTIAVIITIGAILAYVIIRFLYRSHKRKQWERE